MTLAARPQGEKRTASTSHGIKTGGEYSTPGRGGQSRSQRKRALRLQCSFERDRAQWRYLPFFFPPFFLPPIFILRFLLSRAMRYWSRGFARAYDFPAATRST